jgi:chemotaxis receptor (MCP) glutamine deamidase CheD
VTRLARPGSTKPGEHEVTLYIGGIHASREPAVIKTLLGSCIAVCLWEPVARVGGMNHFMLPRASGTPGVNDAARFGVHAMDCLIGEILKLGGDRRRFVAKVFGGAHVLNVRSSGVSVPQQNIDFIRDFLRREGFNLAAEDVGGYYPRHVHFYTATGKARVKQLTSPEARARALGQEQRPEAPPAPRYGDVTLFE